MKTIIGSEILFVVGILIDIGFNLMNFHFVSRFFSDYITSVHRNDEGPDRRVAGCISQAHYIRQAAHIR